MLFGGPAPGLLPTFCALVNYIERPSDSGRSTKIVVTVPGIEQPVASMDIDLTKFNETAVPNPEDEDRVNRAVLPIKLINFTVPEAGLIKVRGYRGDEEYRLGTLRVKFEQSVPSPS